MKVLVEWESRVTALVSPAIKNCAEPPNLYPQLMLHSLVVCLRLPGESALRGSSARRLPAVLSFSGVVMSDAAKRSTQ
jgi:hypothetical protein